MMNSSSALPDDFLLIATTAARPGDVVTIDLDLQPENGFVPECLFDRQGRITLVLGWGNYLPGLHQLLLGHGVGDTITATSLDAGWGARDADLVMTVPQRTLRKFTTTQQLQVRQVIHLRPGMNVTITKLYDDMAEIDANPPLAGSSYACTVTIVSIAPLPAVVQDLDTILPAHAAAISRYEIAMVALGCYFGAELALMRLPGVVGTRVGYSQGNVPHPTYGDVCDGTTQHRETVLVVYDTQVVSYARILQVAWDRIKLADDGGLLPARFFVAHDMELNDESRQYQHGFYYNNDRQREIAMHVIGDRNDIECLPVAPFFAAPDDHQQYLYKGGQSARKNAKERIRCYG